MRTAAPRAPRDAARAISEPRGFGPPGAPSPDVLPRPPFAIELVLRGGRRLLAGRARLRLAARELGVQVAERGGHLPVARNEETGLLARGQDLHDLLAPAVLARPVIEHRRVERRLVGHLRAELVALGRDVPDERRAAGGVGAVLEHAVLVGPDEHERRVAP